MSNYFSSGLSYKNDATWKTRGCVTVISSELSQMTRAKLTFRIWFSWAGMKDKSRFHYYLNEGYEYWYQQVACFIITEKVGVCYLQ